MGSQGRLGAQKTYRRKTVNSTKGSIASWLPLPLAHFNSYLPCVPPCLCASHSSKHLFTASFCRPEYRESQLSGTCQSQASEGSKTPPNMDVVLEVADAFIFDPLWATLLPAASSQRPVANATFSSFKEEPTAYALPHATWQIGRAHV